MSLLAPLCRDGSLVARGDALNDSDCPASGEEWIAATRKGETAVVGGNWDIIVIVALISASSILAILVMGAPRGKVGRVSALWFVVPFAVLFGTFFIALLQAPPSNRSFDNAVFGFMLFSTIGLIPWAASCVLGLAVGLVLRFFKSKGSVPPSPSPPEPLLVAGVGTGSDPSMMASESRAAVQTKAGPRAYLNIVFILAGALIAIAAMTYLTEHLKQNRPVKLTPMPPMP